MFPEYDFERFSVHDFTVRFLKNIKPFKNIDAIFKSKVKKNSGIIIHIGLIIFVKVIYFSDLVISANIKEKLIYSIVIKM